VSAKLEAELGTMSETDRREYLQSLGVEDVDAVLASLAHMQLPLIAMNLLNKVRVYTGPGVPPERSKTTRAHLFQKDSITADDLAGRIHGDIKKGFIRAEVIPAPTLLSHDNYVSARDAGAIRTEGRDYQLQEHDVEMIKWK
jgi:hypothetical protein